MRGDNLPFDSDHDKLIELTAEVRKIDEEIVNLRDWRHNVVAPVMIDIQAQQRLNSQAIGDTTKNVNRLALSLERISDLPDSFRDHLQADREASATLQSAIGSIYDKITANHSSVNSKIDANSTKTLIWIGTIVFTGLLGLIGGMWALLSPHLIH